MDQTDLLLDALKRMLKARGMTYADVAEGIDLSEASVKRIFSDQSFTLKRLEAICDLLGTNIYELARLTPMHGETPTRQLSLSQEEALADDPALLAYFYLLVTGWTAPRIARRFELDAEANGRLLDALDTLKLIRRLPRNRVRVLTGRRIEWRRNGPVRRLYEARVKSEFLKSSFQARDEMMRLESGELSAASVRILERKIERLAAEFDDLAEADVALPPDQKRAFALLLAFRPWTFWSLVSDPSVLAIGETGGDR